MLKFFCAAFAASFFFTAAAAETSASRVSAGIAAYRAGDYAKAWELLTPASAEGDMRAKRYLGNIIIAGKAPVDEADPQTGVEYLKDAARAGDYAALIQLEDLRLAGGAYAPSLDDMISIEIARAENGDPVTAWRLARRYELGEGVAPSQEEMRHWLTAVAKTDASHFPKSGEAAFRLCEIYAIGNSEEKDPAKARQWCARAAKNGSPAAAVMLQRLAQLQD